jgi:hypothetical protein
MGFQYKPWNFPPEDYHPECGSWVTTILNQLAGFNGFLSGLAHRCNRFL